jgi:hypothetical protein
MASRKRIPPGLLDPESQAIEEAIAGSPAVAQFGQGVYNFGRNLATSAADLSSRFVQDPLGTVRGGILGAYETGKTFAQNPREMMTQMAQAEMQRASQALQSPQAAGEYLPSFLNPMRMFRGRSGQMVRLTEQEAEALRQSNPQLYGTLREFLTEKEFQEITPKSAEKTGGLLETYKTMNPEDTAAMAYAGRAKLGWYSTSGDAIKTVFGDDAPRFTALLSSLSPQTSVESNLQNALSVWKNWNASGRPTDRDSIIKIMGDSVQQSPLAERSASQLESLGSRLGIKSKSKSALLKRIQAFSDASPENADLVRRVSVLDAWTNNSVRSLATADPESLILSGPKVDSFMRNLLGDMAEVTNDTWMANAYGIMQDLFAGAARKAASGEKLGMKGPGYYAANVNARQAAKVLEEATGRKWTPAEVQETVWSYVKPAVEERQRLLKSGQDVTISDLVASGVINEDKIRGVADFATLLTKDPKYRSLLEQAGYGQRLAALEANPPSFSPGNIRRSEALEKRLTDIVNKRLDITAATPKKQRGKTGLLED